MTLHRSVLPPVTPSLPAPTSDCMLANLTVERLFDTAPRIELPSSRRCKCEQSPALPGREPRVARNSLAVLRYPSPGRHFRDNSDVGSDRGDSGRRCLQHGGTHAFVE